jgi:hypothetical protein
MATMFDVGLIEVKNRALNWIKIMKKPRKEGMTVRDKTSTQQRYTQMGCDVCRLKILAVKQTHVLYKRRSFTLG